MGQTPPRPTLDALARARINAWIHSMGTTQQKLGEAIGRNQAWMSRYLSGGIDADLDTLEKIAHAFGHHISALLTTPTDPEERQVIDAYRAVPAEDRALAIRVLQKFARPRRPPRKR
jgi:transcriptional regulator with XRE-family HTH domain